MEGEGGRADGLTDIETPHVLKVPPIIAASKYPRHVVREDPRALLQYIRALALARHPAY